MKTITKEQEYELISQLLKLEKQIHFNEMEKNFCTNPSEITALESSLKDLKVSLDKVSNELTDISEPLASIEIKNSLIRTFYQMKTAISNVKYDLSISRRQCLNFENYFASKILDEINRAMNGDFYGLASPFLYLTTDPNDSFDRKQLISFFDSEIDILNSHNSVNYLILKTYYHEFVSRLLKMIEK
jgi:chromosome segregation ATPase